MTEALAAPAFPPDVQVTAQARARWWRKLFDALALPLRAGPEATDEEEAELRELFNEW